MTASEKRDLKIAERRYVLKHFSYFLETHLLENSNRKRVKKGTLMLPFITLSNPFFKKRVPLGWGLSHKGYAFSKKEKKKGSPRTPLKNKIKKYIHQEREKGETENTKKTSETVKSGNFEHKTKKFSFFFDFPLDFSKKRAIILGKGMTTLNKAAAKAADHTFFDRSIAGRLGSRKTGVSLFTLSSRPSFFRAMTSAGKGYSNPQTKEVTEW